MRSTILGPSGTDELLKNLGASGIVSPLNKPLLLAIIPIATNVIVWALFPYF